MSSKGKHWKLSEITKQRIREANLGTKKSEATKQKISKTKTGIFNPNAVSRQKGYNSFIEKRRKIRKKKNGGSHTFGEWNILKAQYNWTCPACTRKEPEIKLTEDHIIPVSKGGSDNIENIQPLCFSCNSKKHTKIIKYTLLKENIAEKLL